MFKTLHTLTEENHHLFTHTKYIFTFEGEQGKRDRDVKSRLEIACVLLCAISCSGFSFCTRGSVELNWKQQKQRETRMNEKHKCCTRERESGRGSTRERSAAQRECGANSFLFGLRLCQQEQQQLRVLLLWRALQHCFAHTHCEHCQTACRQKLSAKTCCSCYCALSLSLSHALHTLREVGAFNCCCCAL